MPQHFDLGHRADRAGKHRTLFRVLAAATLVAVVIGVSAPARAGDDDSEAQASVWSKFMRSLGLKKTPDASGADAGINYTERPPLVVPPSRDLPPPVAEASVPADWPKNSPTRQVKRSKGKPAIIPDTSVQTPNPPYQKKPWYNPTGWFDKTEYANFAGEPVRQDLTDPPAGYRVPSPEQPYGINPDKKAYKPSAKDYGYGQIGGSQAGK
jgi:hypothetical protein